MNKKIKSLSAAVLLSSMGLVSFAPAAQAWVIPDGQAPIATQTLDMYYFTGNSVVVVGAFGAPAGSKITFEGMPEDIKVRIFDEGTSWDTSGSVATESAVGKHNITATITTPDGQVAKEDFTLTIYQSSISEIPDQTVWIGQDITPVPIDRVWGPSGTSYDPYGPLSIKYIGSTTYMYFETFEFSSPQFGEFKNVDGFMDLMLPAKPVRPEIYAGEEYDELWKTVIDNYNSTNQKLGFLDIEVTNQNLLNDGQWDPILVGKPTEAGVFDFKLNMEPYAVRPLKPDEPQVFAYYDIPAQEFTITVLQQTLDAIDDQTVTSGTAIQSITPTFNGPENAKISIEGTLPEGVTWDAETGILSGTPTDEAGSPEGTDYTLTAVYTDDYGMTLKEDFTITVKTKVYAAPTSNADTVEVKTGSPVNIDVLKNDVLNEDGATWEKVSLVDESDNKVEALTTPAGTFTVNADNTITFTAKEGFTGDVPVVKYVATDSNDKDSDPMEINVKVNDYVAPTTNNDTVTMNGTTVNVDVLGNDALNEDGATWKDLSLIDPATGESVKELTVKGGKFVVNESNMTIDFIAEEEFTGDVPPVTYVGTDSNGKSAQGTLAVTVEEVETPVDPVDPEDPKEEEPTDPSTPVDEEEEETPAPVENQTPTPQPTTPTPVDTTTKNPVVIVTDGNVIIKESETTTTTPKTENTPEDDSVLVKTGEVVKDNGGALGAGLLGLGTILGAFFGIKRFRKNN